MSAELEWLEMTVIRSLGGMFDSIVASNNGSVVPDVVGSIAALVMLVLSFLMTDMYWYQLQATVGSLSI